MSLETKGKQLNKEGITRTYVDPFSSLHCCLCSLKFRAMESTSTQTREQSVQREKLIYIILNFRQNCANFLCGHAIFSLLFSPNSSWVSERPQLFKKRRHTYTTVMQILQRRARWAHSTNVAAILHRFKVNKCSLHPSFPPQLPFSIFFFLCSVKF